MKKYISVDDLKETLARAFPKHNNYYRDYHDLICRAEPMIAVSDIEELTDKWKELSFGTGLFSDLLGLIKSKPTKYGGLTIEEWEQLGKLPYASIETNEMESTIMFLEHYQGDFDDIELLPDPQGSFWRYHDGGEQPIPDNVIIEKVRKDDDGYTGTAINIMWAEAFGYRIIGVAEDDKN